MSNITGLYKVRSYQEGDKNFVLATFLRGLYYGNDFYGIIPKQIFMENYKVVAETLVNPVRTEIKVACLVEDEDVILGFTVLSKDCSALHWVFVKQVWRKQGIAAALTPKNVTSYSHFSNLGLILLPKFNKHCVFNPFKM